MAATKSVTPKNCVWGGKHEELFLRVRKASNHGGSASCDVLKVGSKPHLIPKKRRRREHGMTTTQNKITTEQLGEKFHKKKD